MKRYFCDLCEVETTSERAVLPPIGIATVNGKKVRLNFSQLIDDLGWPVDTCSGCLMMAVDSATWILDPSEVIPEVETKG